MSVDDAGNLCASGCVGGLDPRELEHDGQDDCGQAPVQGICRGMQGKEPGAVQAQTGRSYGDQGDA